MENNIDIPKNEFSKKRKKHITMLFVICTAILIAIFGYTYSFFSADITSVNKTDTVLKADSLALTFKGQTEVLNCGNIVPGDKCIKTFDVENESNIATYYNIYMENVSNGFNEDLVITLKEGETTVVNETEAPVTASGKSYILTNVQIPAKPGKHQYTLTLEYKYSATKLQNVNNGKEFSARVGIDTAQNVNSIYAGSKIMAYDSTAQYRYNYEGDGVWQYRSDVTDIIIQTSQSAPQNPAYTFDLSDAQDGSVKGYLVPNANDNTKYKLYIQSNGKLILNEDSSYLFYGFNNLQSFEGLNNVVTKNVTNMSNMFGAIGVSSLDLSSFNTTNVTDMSSMFASSKLQTLNLAKFDTPNLTEMTGMFASMSAATSIDASALDVSKVTSFSGLFAGNTATTINVSGWNTENVEIIGGVFSGAMNVKVLDLRSWKLPKVTMFGGMLPSGSQNLEEVYLNSLDVPTNLASNGFGNFFAGMTNLKVVDLRSFKFSDLTTGQGAGFFNGIASSAKITVKDATEKSAAYSTLGCSASLSAFETV